MARSFFSRKGQRSAPRRGDERPSAAPDGSAPIVDEVQVEGATPTPDVTDDPLGEQAGQEGDGQPTEDRPDLKQAIQGWKASLAEAAKNETRQLKVSSVSLSAAHPGGLASLYAGTATKLSTLIREPAALAIVERDLDGLRVFAEELRETHGTADLHLSIGSASWGGPRPAAGVPPLMRKVRVERVDGEVQLSLEPGVELSARLLREAGSSGAQVDHRILVEALGSSEGMAPTAALQAFRELGQEIPDFELADALSISLIRHPASLLYRDLSNEDLLFGSPLIAALGGVGGEGEERDVVLDLDLRDRDPWQEMGVGDQSPSTQSAVERLSDGGSYTVQASQTGALVSAAVSVAAALAQEGKRVLIVSSERNAREAVASALHDTGLTPVVADFFQGQESVARRLEDALRDVSPQVNMEQIDAMRVALRRARQSLQSYESKLHEEFSDWGVTPFDALQVLTELTSDPDGPSTRVRLGESTLSVLSEDGGEHSRQLLEEASEQGLFNGMAEETPWSVVRLDDAAQAETVLDAVTDLARESLPALRVQMARVAGQTGLRSATTLAGWSAQLSLIEEAQTLLDRFRPEVFDRSPADLVVATATPEWRKQQAISLKRSRRRVLVRQARDLVRPGVHVPDLHAALQEVQSCRQRWIAASTRGEPWPVVPEGLEQCRKTQSQVDTQLALVAPYLEGVFGDLQTMPLGELSAALEALAEDPDGARLQPGRLGILGELDALGLSDLVRDFQERRVDGELIGLELDLCWWASALGLMLAAEPQLGGFDPESLQEQLSDFRRLDRAQVESLGPAIVQRIRDRRREALALYPEQYTALVGGLAEGDAAAQMFGDNPLTWDMLPIVCAGPALVPQLTAKRQRIDAVITVGTSNLSVGEMAPVVARANSLIAFLLPDSAEAGWQAELSRALPRVTLPAQIRAATGPVASVVVESLDQTALASAPAPEPPVQMELLKVEGSGMPAPGAVAVESSLGESEAVAAYIQNVAATDPDQRVCVVTFSEVHADRLRATLRRLEVGDPSFAAWAATRGGSAALVVNPHELADLNPEHTVISVGFAKTPHGRVIHDFGVLSGPEGATLMEALAQGASTRVTVATTLNSEEIDVERLRHPGAVALVDLLRAAEGRAQTPALAVESGGAPDDLLVDLADRLHTMGLEVVPNLGSGAMRIPLAVGHPEVPGRLLVAILTDDPDYLAEPSLRLRDRWKTEQLESLGWKVRTELSMAVFIDPNHEVDQIVDLVLDAVDEHYVKIGSPVTPAAARQLASEEDAPEQDSGPDFLVEDDYDAVYVSTETGMVEVVESQPTPDAAGADEEPAADAVGQTPTPAESSETDLVGEIPESNGEAEPDLDPEPGAGEGPGLLTEVPEKAAASSVPTVVKGLPLAAYSDDQLDEVGEWLWAGHPDAEVEEIVVMLREFLGMRRQGSQSHTVLKHVAERTRDAEGTN